MLVVEVEMRDHIINQIQAVEAVVVLHHGSDLLVVLYL
jgi:hypothetical protein